MKMQNHTKSQVGELPPMPVRQHDSSYALESNGRISDESDEEEEINAHNHAAINDDDDEDYAEVSPSLETKNELFL